MPNDPDSGLPHPASYTVSASGAVVNDRVTRLSWQRQPDRGSVAFEQAPALCEGLALDGALDWRLPTRLELLSLADTSRRAPAIDPVAFPDTPVDFFWTRSEVAGDVETAWCVFFLDGAAVNADRALQGRVRCVRGGAPR